MKTSLYWRFAVVVLVLLAWTYALFPIQDRDFMQTFERMSQRRLEEYQVALESGRARLAELEQRLAQLPDETSTEYRELQQQIDEVRQAVADNELRLTQFDRLMQEARRILDDDEDVNAPYRALNLAAQEKPGQPPIALRHYIPVPTVARPSNSLVLSRVRNEATGTLRLGLDLRGGTEFVIGFDPDGIPPERTTEQVRDQIIEILRNRVDRMGVVEPEIRPVGPSSISLTMPLVSEGAKADVRDTIRQTAELEFYLVHRDSAALAAQYERDPQAFTPPRGYQVKTWRIEEPDGSVRVNYLILTRNPERLRGVNIRRAVATFDEFNNYFVSLSFDRQGAEMFANLTRENVNRQLAIVLDGTVYSAPNINEPITGGQAQITGNFSAEEASRLANVIASGNLPVGINIDSEFGTDPTLGRDSIRSGAIAAVAGLLAVLLFMIMYYRVAGVIAAVALCANILLVFGTLALTGATITLPGIAGVVLVIGMAVDANVLIFERIREELSNGKSIGNAIKSGYNRAFVTILDANLTTLITALILYRVGTGPIRGFAVTLSIGIVASMFTALFMSRAVFDLLLHVGWLKALSMSSLLKEPRFDFLKWRKPAFIVSGVLIVVSLGWALIRNDVMSIDFAGGTAVTVRVDAAAAPRVADVRSEVENLGYTNVRVSYKYAAAGEGRLLELVLPEQLTGEDALDLEGLTAALEQAFPEADMALAQTNSVGGLIGERFQRQAIWAIVLAVVAIVIYISFRFEVAYALGAVAALVHDVIIATGIYLLFGRQLSLPVVAAMLTIMGYSLNDTIVLFDRIREDLSLVKNRKYTEIINLSINQTLSRTLLTSITTLLVVVILFLFGGGAINDFALVMLVGIVIGTYSSIFVASALVATWHKPVRHAG